MTLPPETWLAFAAASAVVITAPGPDMLLVIMRALRDGRLAGVVAAGGIVSGLVVHAAAAVLGLSSLFAHAPLAYDAIRYAGIAYLLWLAWRALRDRGAHRPVAGTAGPAPPPRLGAVYRQAVLTNILNPKIAVFFIAFLPPFVPSGTAAYAETVALLSAAFIAAGGLFLLAVALLAARLRRPLSRLPGLAVAQRYLVASTFAAMAAWLAAQR
ncbi:MAG: LysE family translocator [Alphaproteobacteria bacterium]